MKHRYKENAEKQYDDSSARSPFSSWRRSGNFEEVTSPIAPEAQKEKTKSLEHKTYHRESAKDFLQRDSYQDEGSRSNVKEVSASSEKQADMSTDDLIFNFRQALRRHALSESEKALEHDRSADSSSPKIDMEADATAHRLERLRAARARIHEQRQSDKVHSQSFATEFKGDKEKKDKFDKTRSGSTSSVSSQKSDNDRVNVEEQEAKGEDQKLKHSSKLARQKLVSDDLKAKYMIKRDDEKDKTEPDDILSHKRSDRKERLKEHTEFWSKENDESVPTMAEMLLGSSQLPKSSPLSKKFQNVDHSSPFGSVYSKPSDVVTTTSPPISSSSSTAVTTKASSSNIQTEKMSEKLKNEKLHEKKKTSNQMETNGAKEPKALDKKEKRYKKYTKAKSLELGALSKQENVEPENIVQTNDDTHVDNVTAEDLSQLSRLERIAKYKEERRKQLKTIQDRFAAGDSSELPSLFMSSKPASDESNISRSKSMKVESDTKQAVSSSAIPRSRSMKRDKDHDSDHSDRASPAFSDRHKMPGLRLAEIGTRAKHVDFNKEKDVYEPSEQKYNTDNIIDKLQALRKLKEEHGKELSARHDDAHNVRYTKESHIDAIDVGKPVSYASRALLADRIMESSPKGNAPSPSRELRDKTVHAKHPVAKEPESAKHPSVKENEQKSYFEFGTVFTKKETKVENAKPLQKSGSLEMKSLDDKDSDSGRDSVELTSRIRRRLPSLEDILGTNSVDKDKLEKLPKDSHAKIGKDSRINREPLKELTKEELLTMTADEINRRKVTENIEKAKNRFLEEDKHSGSFDASKFELGTVYTRKRDKPEKREVCDKTVRDEMKPTENISQQDSVERTRQLMLGVDEKEDHLHSQRKSHKIDKQGTDFAQARKETYLSHKEPKNLHEPAKLSHKPEKEIKEEKMSQRPVKETIEEKVLQKVEKDVFSKPPCSPRNERRNQAEQKFGKVSYRSNEAAAFEFGIIYTKKEPVVSKQEDVFKGTTQSEFESKKKDSEPILKEKQDTRLISRPKTKEKSHEQICDELKKDPVSKATIELDKSKIPTLDLTSRKIAQKDRKQETEPVAANHPISPLTVKPESLFKFDIKSQAVSVASGHNVEVPLSPTSPRRMSPCRVFADTYKGSKVTSTKSANVPETVSSTPALKPMTFDVKSSKTSAAIMPMELPRVVQQEGSKLEKIPSLEKADKKPVQTVRKPTPERQTSFTSFEMTSPSGVKSPEAKVDKTVETNKTGTPKERSEFTFESVCQKNDNAELKDEQQKQVTKKPEQKVEQKQKVIKTPETKAVSDSENKVVIGAKQTIKEEKSDISLFEMKKKQVEERLEHKHESIMDEKSVDKQEKKSKVFEMHMKQISEKLEPKRTTTQVEEKVIGIHEIDSEMFEMHRKQIEQKLDPKHATAHVEGRVIGKNEQHSEIPEKNSKQIGQTCNLKREPIKVKKVEKQERGRKHKSRIEKPVHTKLRMEKAFLDTNLDDILSKNVEYLSDLEPPDLTRGRSGAKRERPQSIHEHHRGKRVLKKKVSSRRSKSEDRSHFKVSKVECCEIYFEENNYF